MASLGMFGGGAPRIRRLQPMGNQFAPSIEDMWSQTQAQLQAGQAAQADMMQRVRNSSGPSNSVPRPGGAFGRGPQGQPAPAPVSEQPPQLPPSDPRTGISGAAYRGALGAFMRGPERPASQQPAPTQAPAPIVQGGQAMTRDQANAAGRTQKPGGFLEMFGYDREGTGMEPLEWIFSDRTDVQNAKAEIAARQAAEASAQQRQRERQEIVQRFGPEAGIAYDQNPTEFGKRVAERYGTNLMSQGQTLDRGIDVPGSRFTSAVYGETEGRVYRQTGEGDVTSTMLPKSYDDENKAGVLANAQSVLAETIRNNKATDATRRAELAAKASDLKNNPTGLTDEQVKTEIALSKDWGNVATEWQNVSNLSARAKAMGARKDSVGDLQLVIALTKLADPGTAAREGEVQMSQQTASLVDQASNWVEKLKEGNTLLPDASRDAMIQAIAEMQSVYNDFYEGVGERTKQRAEAYGFDPGRIFLTMQPKSMRAPEQPKPNMMRDAIGNIGNAIQGLGGMFMPQDDGADLLNKWNK